MRTYDYYQIGCVELGTQPMPRWMFEIAYRIYDRYFYNAVNIDVATGEVVVRRDYMPFIPWLELGSIERAVRFGRLVTSGSGDFNGDGLDAAGASGVREPRRPLNPVLSGCASRSMPLTKPH